MDRTPSGEQSNGQAQPHRFVRVDTDALENVVERFYDAGLLLIEAVLAELDETLRLARPLDLPSRDDPAHLNHLLVQVSRVVDRVAVLAEAHGDDGPGHFLGEAARHLHRARMSLVEAQERSHEV